MFSIYKFYSLFLSKLTKPFINMKKKFLFLPIIAIMLTSCNLFQKDKDDEDSSESAQKFYEEIITIQEKVDHDFHTLLDEIALDDEKSILEAKKSLILNIEETQKELDDLDEYDEDIKLKETFNKLLKTYIDIVDEELSEYISYNIYFDELIDVEQNYCDELYEKAMDKYEDALDDFEKIKKEFAEEHEID